MDVYHGRFRVGFDKAPSKAARDEIPDNWNAGANQRPMSPLSNVALSRPFSRPWQHPNVSHPPKVIPAAISSGASNGTGDMTAWVINTTIPGTMLSTTIFFHLSS